MIRTLQFLAAWAAAVAFLVFVAFVAYWNGGLS